MQGKDYSVCLFLTHPDNDADDCMTGEDFDTLEEARACIANLEGTFSAASLAGCPFVELNGPEVYEVTRRPGVKVSRDNDGEWQREQAMQAGMAFGCDGYNDAMGY